jgi:hypothetical protein
MPDGHQFFPQPFGNPAWCFCRDRDCPGWAAYLAWYQNGADGDGEPDDGVIEAHRLITRELATLTRRYSELFGIELDFNTALNLADIERASSPGRFSR